MTFRNFADFKRQLRVGQTFKCEHHRWPHLSGERTISKVQRNAIAYEFDHPEKGTMTGWTHWPPAADIRVEDARVVFLGRPDKGTQAVAGEPWFTYDFAEVEAP